MQVDIRTGWTDAWIEFQWERCHVMFGYEIAEWVVGFRWSSVEDGFKCLTLYFLCFDAHIQVWPKHPTSSENAT